MKKLCIYLYFIMVNICFAMPGIAQNSPQTSYMSYNIRRMGTESNSPRLWKNRASLVIDVIKKINPDIFGLQEPVKKQLNTIASSFLDYKWVGKGRGKAWFGKAKNEYNPIFYRTSKFLLISHGTFFINKSGLLRYKSQGIIPRICTWALLKNRITDQLIYVYNTHLDNHSGQVRKNQLNVIMNDIKKRVPHDIPIFLLGDFNSALTNDIQHITQKAGFIDTKAIAHKIVGNTATHKSWSGNSEACSIDHILLRPSKEKIIIKEYKIVTNPALVEPSDHVPVVVKTQRA